MLIFSIITEIKMRKVFNTLIFFIALLLFIVPYIFLVEYATEVRSLNANVVYLQEVIEEEKRENRLLKQDVEILNNIIISKDFIKRLD